LFSSDLVPSRVAWKEGKLSKFTKNGIDDKSINSKSNNTPSKKLKPEE